MRSLTHSPRCRFPQQAMIVLHHLEGLSYAEVAVVTRSTGLQTVTVNGNIDDALTDDADSR